ncbi:Rrf2 family transcriptional regulator [Phenylobacterium sp.]|uniref:Rrf2 family transcriptional regulator n=1 Tax=Phenylobacterium sp. TaxID=1871053 RepID=UPI0030F3741D
MEAFRKGGAKRAVPDGLSGSNGPGTDGRLVVSRETAGRGAPTRQVLAAILRRASRNQVVRRKRGESYGALLGRPPAEISFVEMVGAVDGPPALAPCVSRLSFRKCDDCPDLATCSLREALLRARDATSDVLEGYSLAEAAACEGAEVLT